MSDEGKERVKRAVEALARLTARQRQVLVGMVEDQPNKVIASSLGIDEKTVKMHRAALLMRLGTRSAGAVRIAVEASFAPHVLEPA